MNERLIEAACALRLVMLEEVLTERAYKDLWIVRDYLVQSMSNEEYEKYSGMI